MVSKDVQLGDLKYQMELLLIAENQGTHICS